MTNVRLPSTEAMVAAGWLTDVWLPSIPGPGLVQHERERERIDLSNVDATTWRATFDREPLLSSDGFGTGPTPWRAVQVAALEALSAGRLPAALATFVERGAK